MVAAPVTQEEQDAEAANGMGQGAGAGAEGGNVPAPGQGNNDANNAAQGRGPYLCTFYGGTLPILQPVPIVQTNVLHRHCATGILSKCKNTAWGECQSKSEHTLDHLTSVKTIRNREDGWK